MNKTRLRRLESILCKADQGEDLKTTLNDIINIAQEERVALARYKVQGDTEAIDDSRDFIRYMDKVTEVLDSTNPTEKDMDFAYTMLIGFCMQHGVFEDYERARAYMSEAPTEQQLAVDADKAELYHILSGGTAEHASKSNSIFDKDFFEKRVLACEKYFRKNLKIGWTIKGLKEREEETCPGEGNLVVDSAGNPRWVLTAEYKQYIEDLRSQF